MIFKNIILIIFKFTLGNFVYFNLKFRSIITAVTFEKQPPDNLRKSNFFHFDLSFLDLHGFVATIDKSQFVGFLEDTEVYILNFILQIYCRMKNN